MAKWNELPFGSKLGIVVGLAAVVTGLAWYLTIKPLADQNKKNEGKLAAVKADNDSLRPYVGKLADMDRQIESLKQQLEIQKRIVPDEKEADNFIRLVQSTAAASGIEVRRFTAQAIQNKEFFAEAPFELELDGPYYSVLGFFDRLAKLERIINVSALQMATVNKASDAKVKHRYEYAPGESVVATCVATTYFSRAEVPAPAPAKPGAPAGK
ncbi:MAG TPA: type 4a pilus biogenesis protein PilO [Terriglobales bacterium]|nr:type 4a pilus biogenesis protein PilO [Terriglobales bacterium]